MRTRPHDAAARRLLVLGHELAIAGRAAAALPYFDRALARDPLAAYGFLYRAGLRVLAGDGAGAASDLDALAALPSETFVRYREFEIPAPATYPGFDEKLDAFAARTRHPFAYLLRAFVRRAGLRYDEAILDMERAVRLSPRNAGLRAVLARVRFVNRLPKAALADLDAAARLHPGCGWIRAWRAEALRHRGRFAEALADADRAIGLDPHYFRSYAWRGGILRMLGKPSKALPDFERALSVDWHYWWGLKEGGREADPNLSWALHEKSLALRGLGRTAEAVRSLNEAHRLNTRYGWVWTAGRDEASYASGEAELDALLEKDPADAWARAWRGWTRLESGRSAEALADLDAAARKLPREAGPAVWLARALAGAGRLPAALKAASRAARLDPLYAPAHGWRGGLLRASGREAEALVSLDRALALDSVLAWAWAWKGECLLRLARPAEALEPLRRATALDPFNADARVWRAEALAAAGRRAEAVSAARAALALRPDHWRALAVLAALTGRRSLVARALAAVPGGPR